MRKKKKEPNARLWQTRIIQMYKLNFLWGKKKKMTAALQEFGSRHIHIDKKLHICKDKFLKIK